MSVVGGGSIGPTLGSSWHPDRRSALEHSLFAVLPVLLCGFVVYEMVKGNIVAIDFRDAYRVAGHRVLTGISPYEWTQAQIKGGEVFVYPSLAALLMVPFALLPAQLSSLLFSALCAGAVVATLRVLEVRDWRLYGLALVCPWVVAGWQTGNLTLLLGLGIALVWRYRDHPLAAGLLVGALVSLKPFTAPLGLWLLATRRYRSLAWAIAGAGVLSTLAWGVIGVDEIRRYLDLSSAVTGALEHTGYGVIGATGHLGLGSSTGVVLELVLAGVAAIVCVRAGRRGSELPALTATVMLMLVASPLVWSHYFALLLVPTAIAYPRLSRAWLLPLLLWGCAVRGAAEWQVVLTWGIVAAICWEIARPRAAERAVAC